MLENIPKEDLIHNYINLNKIIKEFFIKIKSQKMDSKNILEELNYTIQQISIYNTSKKYEFKKKLNYILLNNN